MKRRRRSSSSRREILIILLLFALVVILFVGFVKANRKLTGIRIIDWQEGSYTILNGKDIDTPTVALTPAFISKTVIPQSPFNDGKSLIELIDEYVKYGRSDMFGSPRRTGEIRRIHEGIDLYVPEDTPLYPVFPLGIVTEISNDPHHIFQSTGYRNSVFVDSVGVEYGKIIRILYPEGIESLYAHLNEIYVEEGQIVTSETVVGTSGYTGNIRFSGKPSHLHLELRDINNNSFDPEYRLHFSQNAIALFIGQILEITN